MFQELRDGLVRKGWLSLEGCEQLERIRGRGQAKLRWASIEQCLGVNEPAQYNRTLEIWWVWSQTTVIKRILQ